MQPSDIIVFIFVLGILVFVHEFGHYAVAKLFKIRVEVFSLGFGKRLFGFRRGDTDYRISLLPLGGYVKMAGENPLESRTGDPDEFMSHPRWQRFLVAIAGPVMNILLAIVVLTGLYTVHFELPQKAEIGWVMPGSPADQAGIKGGDKIVKIGDIQNPDWEKTDQEIMLNAEQRVDISVQRGDQVIATTVTPQKYGPEEVGNVGWDPQAPALIDDLTPGLPAEKAGIKPGDTIVALNGKTVHNFNELIRQLQANKTTPVEVTTQRGSQVLKFNLTPVLAETGAGNKTYQIGVKPGYPPVEVVRLPFGKAFAAAVTDSKDNSTLIFRVLGKMIRRKGVSIKQMSGPVGIMRYSGAAYRLGPAKLSQFMALISLNLAIFNLLPIPILDGGLMLMLLVESVMRRDIRQDVKERVYQAAFVFLVIFAAVVIFNDVSKLPGISHFRQ